MLRLSKRRRGFGAGRRPPPRRIWPALGPEFGLSVTVRREPPISSHMLEPTRELARPLRTYCTQKRPKSVRIGYVKHSCTYLLHNGNGTETCAIGDVRALFMSPIITPRGRRQGKRIYGPPPSGPPQDEESRATSRHLGVVGGGG